MRLEGGCHCGRLRVAFTTATALTELPLRACQCTFCRRHGALTTSDPAGEVVLSVSEEPAAVVYYPLGQLYSPRMSLIVRAAMPRGGAKSLASV